MRLEQEKVQRYQIREYFPEPEKDKQKQAK
jgi:hypothetical protein